MNRGFLTLGFPHGAGMGGEAAPPSISNQTIAFGALTLSSAGGAKALSDAGSEVDFVSVDSQGSGSGWTVSSGRLIRSTGTPSTQNGVVLTCTTSLGQISVTIQSSGTDADGYNLANGYFVSDIDQLEVVLETALTYGTHWIGIRNKAILNPDADINAALIRPVAYSGTKTAPTQLTPADNGVDVDTGSYIVVKPEAGGTAKIRRIRLQDTASSQGGIRFTGIDFEWQPETSLGDPKNIAIFRVGVNDVLIDNCSFQSTITTTDNVPLSCIQTDGPIDKLVIQDNTANDFDHFLVNSYEGTNLQIVGNELRSGWADQIYFNSGGQNVRINWNIITDKKHKNSGTHPDFIQVAANSGDNDLDNWEFIGNQIYRGIGVAGRNDGQGIFIKDIPYIGVYSSEAGGTFAADKYVEGSTSGAIARIASKGTGTLRLLPAADEVDFSTLFTPGETITEYTSYNSNTNAVSSPTGVTATLDSATPLNVTNLVIRGNFVNISLTNAIYAVRAVDAVIRNNTALLDPTTFIAPTATSHIAAVGYSDTVLISDNICNGVTVSGLATAVTEENNTEITTETQAAYEAVFVDPQFNDNLTDPATQYDIIPGGTEDLADPKRGCTPYVDFETRTTSFPNDGEELVLTNMGGQMRWPGVCSNATTLAAATMATLDAAGEYVAFIMQAKEAMVIDRVGFKCGAVSGSPTGVVSIEGVDSSGMPDGSDDVFGTNCSATTATLTANSFPTTALSGAATIPKGSWFAVKVAYNAGTSFIIQQVNGPRSYGPMNAPYSVINTGSPTKTAITHNAAIALGSNATTFYSLPNVFPVTSVATSSFDNTNGNRRGLRFQVPFMCRAAGIAFWNSTSTGGFNAVIRDDSGAELSSSSVAVDGDYSMQSASAIMHVLFDNGVELTPGTWYRAAIEPSAAVNVSLGVLTLPNANYRSGMPHGVNAHYTTYASGSWTDSATDQLPWMDIIIDQLGAPA